MTVRVVVADDEPVVRAGLVMLLNAEPGIEVVAEAGDGAAAVAAAAEHACDVVLLDVRMPGMGGVEATRHVMVDPRTKGCRVLVLTSFDADEDVFAALRAGACGFLLKDSAVRELIQAIHAVAEGRGWLDPAVTLSLLREFARLPTAQPARRPEALSALTTRELDVLVLVAMGLSNAEIADRLVISHATAKTHVNRILGKLGLHDRAKAVALAYQAGLIDLGHSD